MKIYDEGIYIRGLRIEVVGMTVEDTLKIR
jgi:hypothetical protein